MILSIIAVSCFGSFLAGMFVDSLSRRPWRTASDIEGSWEVEKPTARWSPHMDAEDLERFIAASRMRAPC